MGEWNEPLPMMDDAMKNRIIQRTDEYLSVVQWRNDGNPNSLQEALQMAKVGKDGGQLVTMELRPTTNDFHAWMDWSALVTFLYNRDTSVRTLLSALRKVISHVDYIMV